MPTHENIKNLVAKKRRRGLTGRSGARAEILAGEAGASTIHTLGDSKNVTPPTIGAVTPGATQLSVAFTDPGDNNILTVRVNSTKEFVKKVEGASSPLVATGLAAATAYEVDVRAEDTTTKEISSPSATATGTTP